MTVGLFGWYHKGNFGDDLMAMMFTEELVKRGYEVVLWGIEAKKAEQWGAKTSRDVDSFLSSIDVLVFGGGGILANAHVRDDFDRLVEGIVQEASSRRIPVHGVSLGGDGTLAPECVSSGRKALLEHVSLLTVRNPQDLDDVARFDVQAHFHHDVVWSCPQYASLDLVRKERAESKKRILANVEEKSVYRRSFIVAIQIANFLSPASRAEYLSIIRESGELHTLQNRLQNSGLMDYTSYPGVEKTLRRVGAADILISSKMHIGMCALAMGIPFVSVFGEEKTRIMMENLGIERFFVGKRPLKAVTALSRAFSESGCLSHSFDEEKRDARNHIERLLHVL